MSNIAKLEFVALDITGKNYLSWERYDHQKTVILPNARYDWMHLRLQDFKSVSEYNSAMFRITSQLKLCGEKITDMDMLEKTYSTFHANNVVLQTQYREKGFTKYSELISCLLVAEQNNELLMKNHESRPTGSTHFPKQIRGRGGYFKKTHSHLQWNRKDDKGEKDKSENVTNKCYRCGAKGHWSRVCRTPKHLKRKNVETNMVIEDAEGDFDSGDATHLEVADFFPTPKGN
ncbi:hypothetical protein RND81_06G026800 [Saponaria officinalis]|uniref:CCHC-type domain-containing protein n=1 Tax=Saponaria officinalis TaxID=3572 RepID=A0AAW1K729_SAPOF